MQRELRRIADEAWKIVLDTRSTRIEKLEALKLIAACKGVLLAELDERWLTVKQVCQLRQAKQQIVERVLRKKERRKRANRRAYLRRAIRAAEAQQEGHSEQIH
ncbi:MAG TPA: hypothetical protein VFA60_01090 [Terriglobales bacterium]|nr:hypothetical protein [Terriglobales bacterium]